MRSTHRFLIWGGLAALGAGLAWLVLLPRAREAPPSRSTCARNLRMLGLAMEVYAQDYDGQYPRATAWEDEILPYTRRPEVAHCPQAPGSFGYAFNSALDRKSTAAFDGAPAQPLLFDSRTEARNASDPLTSFLPRHSGYGNVLHTDGRVERRADPPEKQ